MTHLRYFTEILSSCGPMTAYALLLISTLACQGFEFPTDYAFLPEEIFSETYDVLDGYPLITTSGTWLWNQEGLHYSSLETISGVNLDGTFLKLHDIPFLTCSPDRFRLPLLVQEQKGGGYWIDAICTPTLGFDFLSRQSAQENSTFYWSGEPMVPPLRLEELQTQRLQKYSRWLMLNERFCSWENAGEGVSAWCHEDRHQTTGNVYDQELLPRVITETDRYVWLQDYYGRIYSWKYTMGEPPLQVLLKDDPVSRFRPVLSISEVDDGTWVTVLDVDRREKKTSFESSSYYLKSGSDVALHEDDAIADAKAEPPASFRELNQSLDFMNHSEGVEFLRETDSYIWFCIGSKTSRFNKESPYSIEFIRDAPCFRYFKEVRSQGGVTWAVTDQGVYSLRREGKKDYLKENRTENSGYLSSIKEFPLHDDISGINVTTVDMHFTESATWLVAQNKIFRKSEQDSFSPIEVHISGGEQRIFDLGSYSLIQTSQILNAEWAGLYKLYLYSPELGVRRVPFPYTEELIGRSGRALLIENVRKQGETVWILLKGHRLIRTSISRLLEESSVPEEPPLSR